MKQYPFIFDVWPCTSNTFLELFKNLAVKILSYHLPWRIKLFVDDFCSVHKANEHVLGFLIAHSCILSTLVNLLCFTSNFAFLFQDHT